MPDIWEIHSIIRSPIDSIWSVLRNKPVESLTALFLLIGLLMDSAYRKKRLNLEIVSYDDYPQDNIEKELIFRIINTGNKEIYLRTKGVGTFNKLNPIRNHSDIKPHGYDYGIYEGEEVLFPGKSIQVKALQWQEHKTGGFGYVYAIDQTGKQWKKYLSLNTEIRYRFHGLKKLLRK